MTTYYVAPNGNDNNSGSINEPWETGNHRLAPGDTVYFRAGTYRRRLIPQSSGTSQEPITFANYRNETAKLVGESGTERIIDIRSCHNIVIDGFELEFDKGHSDPGTKKWALVDVRNSVRNITLRNLYIHKDTEPLSDYRKGYREMGIQVSESDRVMIEGCQISGMNMGIALRSKCTNTWIKRNRISNTVQSCIVFGTSLGTMRGCLVERNLLEGSVIEDGIQFMQDYNAPDTSLDVSNRGTIIRNNVIRNNNENAVDLKGARFICIEENVIYGTVGSSDGPLRGWNRNALYGIARGNRTECQDVIIRHNIMYDNPRAIKLHGENTKVYNNTIVFNNRDYTGSDSSLGTDGSFGFVGIFQQFSNQINLGIRNNIIGGHKTGQVALRLGSTSIDIDYNLYFQGPDGAPVNVDYRSPTNQATFRFGAWQSVLNADTSVSGGDSHSQWISWDDVAFVNVPAKPTGAHTNYDFELQQRSAAYESGGPLTHVRGSGSDNRVTVDDASWFMDGYTSALVEGDTITVDTQTAAIREINTSTNTLILDRRIQFRNGAPVYFGATNRPHMGAQKNSGDVIVPPTPDPTPVRIPKLLWVGNPVGVRVGTSE